MHLHGLLWSKYLTSLTTVRMHPFCNLNLQFAQNVYKNLNCWILPHRLIFVQGLHHSFGWMVAHSKNATNWGIRNVDMIYNSQKFQQNCDLWIQRKSCKYDLYRPYKHINNIKSAVLAFLQIKFTVHIHIYVNSRQLSFRM